MGVSLQTIGNLFKKLGHYEKAESCFKQSLQISELLFGENSAQVGGKLFLLGDFLKERGKFEECLSPYSRTLSILSNYGKNNHDYI